MFFLSSPIALGVRKTYNEAVEMHAKLERSLDDFIVDPNPKLKRTLLEQSAMTLRIGIVCMRSLEGLSGKDVRGFHTTDIFLDLEKIKNTALTTGPGSNARAIMLARSSLAKGAVWAECMRAWSSVASVGFNLRLSMEAQA